MAIELATAYVQIVPTTKDIESNITSAISGDVISAGDKAGLSFGSGFASSIAKGLAAGVGAITGAAVAITKSIVSGAKSVAEYGDNIDKMSQKIGISAESYQKWDYVMQRAGTSVDNLKIGMKTLSSQAMSNSDAFQKLGISEEQVATLSQEDLFGEVIKGLSGMEAGSERTALATQLLGKAGADLGPLLNEGTEEIENQMKMAEQYGMVMSDEAVAASAVFEDSLTTLNMTMTGLKNGMLSEFLPALTQVTDGLALLLTGDMSGLDQITEGIEGMVDKISESIPMMLEVGMGIVESLCQAIIANLPSLISTSTELVISLAGDIIGALPELGNAAIQIVKAIADGIMNSMGMTDSSMEEVLTSILDEMIAKLPEFLADGVEFISSIANGILNNLPTAISSIGTILSAVLEALMNALPQLLASGVSLIGSLAKGVINNIPAIVSSIAQVIAKLLATIGSNIPQIIASGVNILTNLANGLAKAIPVLLGKIPGIITGIRNAFSGTDWGSIGRNILSGIGNGIVNAVGGLVSAAVNACKNLVSAVKGFFGIHSPSTLMADQIGKFIPPGIAEGITDNADVVEDAMEDMLNTSYDDYSVGLNANGWLSAGAVGGSPVNTGDITVNVYGAEGQDEETLADKTIERIKMVLRGEEAVYE